MPARLVRLRLRGTFAAGALCGALLLLAVRVVVNETTFADRLVSPLLVPDVARSSDTIVALGGGVVGECGTNLNSARRVLLAARLWRDRPGSRLVFTGRGEPDPAVCPVAEAMAALAREIGVPDSAVYVETMSRTTRENAELSAPLLRRLGARRVLIVTDRLHMRRAAGTFEQLGFEVDRASVPIYEGHPDNISMLGAAFREMAALTYYRMVGWAEWGTREQRAPPPDESALPTIGIDVSHPEGPIIVLGASYAKGWEGLESAGGAPVINWGAAGQQSFELLERFERDVHAARPSAVILWGFINDIFRAPGNVEPAVARARESFAGMIELARSRGIEPIVATEVTIRPPASRMNGMFSLIGRLRGKESYADRINRHVIATNQWLVDLARREGLLLLDLQSTLAEQGGRRRPEFTAEDGSHITRAGYDALTAYAQPILERHFAARRAGIPPRPARP